MLQAHEIVAILTTLLLLVVIVAVIVGLIWLRFFAERPCRKVKSIINHEGGAVETIMADGTSHWSYQNRKE